MSTDLALDTYHFFRILRPHKSISNLLNDIGARGDILKIFLLYYIVLTIKY